MAVSAQLALKNFAIQNENFIAKSKFHFRGVSVKSNNGFHLQRSLVCKCESQNYAKQTSSSGLSTKKNGTRSQLLLLSAEQTTASLALAVMAAGTLVALKNAALVACQAVFSGFLASRKEILIHASRGFLSTAGPLFFAAMDGSERVNTPLTVIAAGMSKWLDLYSGLLLVRVLLSWFPNIDWERQPMMAVRDLADPYLNLFRNILVSYY